MRRALQPVAEQEGFRRLPLAGFTDDEDPRGRRFAAPWSPQKSGPLPYASTLPEMEQFARTQMRDFPDTGRGGRLLVAELTSDSIAITSQCDLQDETVPSLAAVRETRAGHAVMFGRQMSTAADIRCLCEGVCKRV